MILLLAGCAFGPGTGFATLRGAELVAAFVPGEARDLGGDVVLTDQGFEVRLDRFEVDADGIELLELEGGVAGAFDPADPPPGYSLCHGGHCHADDGALVSYAEIEAELAGDGAALVPIVSFPLDGLDLLAGVEAELRPRPGPELPEARITIVRLLASAVRLEGEVAGVGPLVVDLPLGPVDGGTELVVDRSAPAALRLAIGWTVDGTLLDGIDLDDPAAPLADELFANLGAAAPTLEVR